MVVLTPLVFLPLVLVNPTPVSNKIEFDGLIYLFIYTGSVFF